MSETHWINKVKEVTEENIVASLFLQFCAFIAPKDIPFRKSAHDLIEVADTFLADYISKEESISQRDGVFEILEKHALIERNAEQCTLSIDPLLQEALRAAMLPDQKIKVLNTTCEMLVNLDPGGNIKSKTYKARVFPHQQTCAKHLEELGIENPAVGNLFNQFAIQLDPIKDVDEVLRLLDLALVISETQLGPHHPQTGGSLNNLASIYFLHKRFAESIPLLQKAFEISLNALGHTHDLTQSSFLNMIVAHAYAGKYKEAQALLEKYPMYREPFKDILSKLMGRNI